MRIAQVAPLSESVPPRLYGGTERVVSWLTETLVQLGHDVTLFASGDSVTNATLVPICEKALRLDSTCVDPLAHHVLMIEDVFSRAADFDLIHFHVDYLHFSLSKRAPVACLTTLHGRLDLPDLVPLFERFRDQPVVSISDRQRKPLPWLNWLGTVPHGLPEDSLSLHSSEGDYLAFLGRISPEKGLDQAIRISRRAGIPLKIAAKIDRADREYFAAKIKPLLADPLIDFVGEIGNSEKDEFLGNAKALLFPIQWPEPFGLVMIEAMACGTPVIAYPFGSVPEVIRDGVCGYLVADIDEAVRAIDSLPNLDRHAIRRHFELNFTADRMARKYLSIYQKLISSKSASITVGEGVLNWMELEPSTPSTT
ncbi:MAG TPA: glycosyltransferase family 4 protein [Candidatus Sulfotelmatobacter sp.]|jgi:glycosyltransferase involved in cell wall biosynthesis|nr:glycosyltransferase family 4 protein [Candidatus Sulfotelmatobacter sp.]